MWLLCDGVPLRRTDGIEGNWPFHELPLALFTTLASIGAGAFISLAAAFFTAKFSDGQLARIDKLTLVPAIVVVVGFIAAFFHLANPMAAFGVFGGLGRSPMSNELAVAMLFAVAMATYVIMGLAGKLGGARKGLVCATAVLAVLFAVFMGLAYGMATIPTWSTPWPVAQMIGYALLGGAAMGACVLAFSDALDAAVDGTFKSALIAFAVIGAVLAVAGLALMYSGAGSVSNAFVAGTDLAAGASGAFYVAVACLILACAAVIAAALGKGGNAASAIAVILAFAGILAGRFVFYALQISVGISF